jgi:mRNA interferase MazF
MKGEIWLVELPSANGHEQSGMRPVILLADTEAKISIVIPCTSNVQALRFPHTLEIEPSKDNGLTKVSIALVFQIRAIDRKRLKKRIGHLEKVKLEEIDSFLRKLIML